MTEPTRHATSTLVGFLLAGCLAGCQTDYRKSTALVTSQELAGEYEAAAASAAGAVQAAGSDSVSRVIYLLEAGRTAQIAGSTQQSVGYYDTAF